MTRKRVLVVANKWWECDPIMSVLLNNNVGPAPGLGWPSFLNHPHRRPDQKNLPAESTWPVPRAIFTLSNSSVEVWCISDLLGHLPDRPEDQSSSERKIEQLPNIFVGQKPNLVVAIGTAAFPSDTSENGNVIIGTEIFMHNGDPKNPASHWDSDSFDKVIPSGLGEPTFTAITSIEPAALVRFLTPPLNAAAKAELLAGYDYVALGTVNVTDPKKYAQADQATFDAYKANDDPALAKSLETTHGLVRVQSEAPFIFVSGIANRVGHFNDEVNPRQYAQNTTVAHNAGVVLAWMIPKINDFF